MVMVCELLSGRKWKSIEAVALIIGSPVGKERQRDKQKLQKASTLAG